MDTVSIIRVIAAVVAIVLMGMIVTRRKRLASVKTAK